MKLNGFFSAGFLALVAAAGCGGAGAVSPSDIAFDDDEEKLDSALGASRTPLALSCSSPDVPAYYETTGDATLSATFKASTVLRKVALEIKAKDHDEWLGAAQAVARADKKYKPRKYKDHQRFVLDADDWCVYTLILPKALASQTGAFNGYLMQACDGGFVAKGTLSCTVSAAQ